MFELVVWPEAECDIRDTRDWYENRRDGLGDDFLECLDEAFEKLTRIANVFGVVHAGLRRMQVRRFPYGIYFDVIDETVVIVAVLHARQNLDYLVKRIRHH